ncbi:hypothetical protein ACFLQL_04065 [Verrucomicrobiota bacterium]
MNFNDYITPVERLTAMKRGFLFKMAEMTKDEQGKFSAKGFSKCAGTITDDIWKMVKFVMLTGVGLGIPAGVLLHHLDKRISPNRLSERDLIEKAKLYKGLTGNLGGLEIPKNEPDKINEQQGV